MRTATERREGVERRTVTKAGLGEGWWGRQVPDLEDSKVSDEQMAHEYGANGSEFSKRNIHKAMGEVEKAPSTESTPRERNGRAL